MEFELLMIYFLFDDFIRGILEVYGEKGVEFEGSDFFIYYVDIYD